MGKSRPEQPRRGTYSQHHQSVCSRSFRNLHTKNKEIIHITSFPLNLTSSNEGSDISDRDYFSTHRHYMYHINTIRHSSLCKSMRACRSSTGPPVARGMKQLSQKLTFSSVYSGLGGCCPICCQSHTTQVGENERTKSIHNNKDVSISVSISVSTPACEGRWSRWSRWR